MSCKCGSPAWAARVRVVPYAGSRSVRPSGRTSTVAELLGNTLAEEELSDNVLTQITRKQMSEARTGMTKEPTRVDVMQE
jgi:hypothetical protein